MAKRKPAETLGDLLLDVIRSRHFSRWCEAADLRPNTVSGLIDGLSAPRRATVIKLAAALGVDEARVRAACEASRSARA